MPKADTRRVGLADGSTTAVHVVSHPLRATRVRVLRLEPEAPFEAWCAERGIREAVSGGYAVKPDYVPLGEHWIDGRRRPHRPFAEPWRASRAAVLAVDGRVEIEHRDRLPERPDGDLLQAGPLLVRDGRSAIAGTEDPEGFSTTSQEFDQDLVPRQHPRDDEGQDMELSSPSVTALVFDGR